MAEPTFKKITSAHDNGGLSYTVTDYIAEEHVLPYVLHQNSSGWAVQSVEDDDRPADADRTYLPAAYLTEGN